MARWTDAVIATLTEAMGVSDGMNVKMDVDNLLARIEEAFEAVEVVSGVTITVVDENANAVRVWGQITDKEGVAIAQSVSLMVMLSDSAAGLNITGDVPDGGVADGGEGFILEALVATSLIRVQTNAAGIFDLDYTDAASMTKYPVVIMPNGTIVVGAQMSWT